MAQDPDITPDDRDWTYVIDEGCRECGFVPQDPQTTGDRLRAAIPVWRDALADGFATRRPAPGVWSAAEYGCHVRDASRIFRERLELMLAADDPIFANWDQDATAIDDGYSRQQPGVVAAQIAEQLSQTAAAFDAVQPDQWTRPGRRSNGSAFTVATFAVYFLHDIEHHIHDVTSRR